MGDALTTFPCKFGPEKKNFSAVWGVHVHPLYPLATPMTQRQSSRHYCRMNAEARLRQSTAYNETVIQSYIDVRRYAHAL